LHCSDSPHGRGDDAETIHKWQLQNGWDGIGYHYVITESGEIQNGRPTYWTGSHARGHNNDIGICLIGQDVFTPEQFYSLSKLLKKLTFQFSIDMKHVIGHCDVSDKTCPNFDVEAFKDEYSLS